MLKRQAVWVPAVVHNTKFADAFHRFIQNNPLTAMNVALLGITPERMVVALETDSTASFGTVAGMLAYPITIPSAACDSDMSHHGHRQGTSSGLMVAACDSCNSFHVMQRLLPEWPVHVSVKIHMEVHRSPAAGEHLILMSTIEKLGKNLVYCRADCYVDKQESLLSLEHHDMHAGTVSGLREALHGYEKVFTCSHVKAISVRKAT